jgi:hypothetical protein
MKELTFTIKENSDTVIIKSTRDNKTLEILKKQFNESFTETPQKGIFTMNEEAEKKTRKMSEIINSAVVALVTSRATDPSMALSSYAILGSICNEFCKEFNSTPADFLKILKQEHDKFMEKSINELGIHFGERHNVPKRFKKKNYENKIKLEKDNAKYDSDKMSIGDMIKAKNEFRGRDER